MPDEVVPEVPEVETPKLETPEVPIVQDDKRRAVEEALALADQDVPEESKAEDKSEVKKDPKEDIEDPVERIKKATQKRIDKLTAKSRSAEEELAEARAEIERLKNSPKEPEKQTPKDDTPPTPEQVEAYIAKMQEEGNHKEAAAAIRYLVKLEKETALKEVREEQNKSKTQNDVETARTNAAMRDLANDYVTYDDSGKPDITSDMTLANQKGELFQRAKAYFDDPKLHSNRYNDPNIVNGFRRAVADAYRDIMEDNRTKQLTPKGENEPKRNNKQVLADPGSDFSDDISTNANSNSLSDAEKVRAELLNRKKIFKR